MIEPPRRRSRRSFLRAASAGFLSGAWSNGALREAAQGAAAFTDIAAQAGLGAARNVSGPIEGKQLLLEEMGCGVAIFDYDNDGWPDIFLVNGTTLEGEASGPKPTSYLFHNNRDGTFTDVTLKAGLAHSGWGQACCVGDYDNDGFDDLFVSYWGQNVLYHNNGDGTFTNVAEEAGVAGSGNRWGVGCCFLDYDRDGHLDLFVANYIAFDPLRAPRPGASHYCRYGQIPVPCGPQGFMGGTNLLYRNRGNGTFEDVSEKAGIVNPRGASSQTFAGENWRPAGSYGMGATAADWDNDGWPDIYVACDTAPSLLYHNNQNGTFTEVGVEAGCALDENGVALSGMGAGTADFDGDGWLDVVRSNFTDQVTVLYRNNGDGTFQDVTLRAGLGINTKYLGFGVGFLDFDNDGHKDIFIANGHVYSQIAGRKLHISYKQPRLLYRNLGNGRFQDISASAGPGVTALNLGRGCAFGDLDNDGRLEIVINNLDGPPSLLHNSGANANTWLNVKCVGTRSNRSAIGTRVSVTAGGRTRIDEVISGSGYYSQNDLRLHFGLGTAQKADVLEIAWPSGLRETFRDVEANQFVTIAESSGTIRRERYRRGR